MRIDQKQSATELNGPGSTERVGTDGPGRAGQGSRTAKTDSVEVSSDARLMNQALRAASEGTGIRQDRVDAVRKKLEAGELGNDANRLADRLIDDLTGR